MGSPPHVGIYTLIFDGGVILDAFEEGKLGLELRLNPNEIPSGKSLIQVCLACLFLDVQQLLGYPLNLSETRFNLFVRLQISELLDQRIDSCLQAAEGLLRLLLVYN